MPQLPKTRIAQAALCAVSGMTLMGFIDNFVKLIAEDIGLWQFHFVRSCIVMGTVVPVALFMGWHIRPISWGAVAVRGFFIASAMILYFGALAALPIAQVGAGLFTAPIFVLVFSALFYGVRIGPARIAAVALGFLGVLVMLRPDAESFSAMSLVPILAGALYGFGAVCTREYCANERTVTLVMGFFAMLGLWGAVGLAWFAATGQMTTDGGTFFTTGWQPFTGRALFWTVAQGFVSLAAIMLITRAYLLAEASHVAVFEYAFLISAVFWSYVLWGEAPDALGAVGIVLIVAAGVVIILRTREAEP